MGSDPFPGIGAAPSAGKSHSSQAPPRRPRSATAHANACSPRRQQGTGMSEQNRSTYWNCALAPLLLLAATHTLADCEARSNPRTPKGQWYLHWENDLFTRFASDEYFTNGLRVGYAWDPGCERRWIAREGEWLEATPLGRKLGLGDPAKYTRSAMFGIGQSIYTPSNIRIA